MVYHHAFVFFMCIVDLYTSTNLKLKLMLHNVYAQLWEIIFIFGVFTPVLN